MKKYTITIEVTFVDAPKGTGVCLIDNVTRVSADLLHVPNSMGVALVDTWDVKVKKGKK